MSLLIKKIWRIDSCAVHIKTHIFHFVKEKGYTLQGAKDKLKGGLKESDQVKVEVIDKLKSIKEQLLKMKNEI